MSGNVMASGIVEVESRPRFQVSIAGDDLGVFEVQESWCGFSRLMSVKNSREHLVVRDRKESVRHLAFTPSEVSQLSEGIVVVDVSTSLAKRFPLLSSGDLTGGDDDDSNEKAGPSGNDGPSCPPGADGPQGGPVSEGLQTNKETGE
jgi:hypothetical protein